MDDPPLILLVDEDGNFTRILETKLRLTGFNVLAVPGLAAAAEALRANRPALVLLDARLPDGNGIDELPALRALSPTSAYIIITAYEEERLRERAMASGAAEVLYKPFDLELLVHTIHHYLPEAEAARFAENACPCILAPGQAVVITLAGEHGPVDRPGRVTNQRYESFDLAMETGDSFPPGARVVVRMAGEDGLYRFRTQLLPGESTSEKLSLKKPRVIYRQQRRKHSRVPLSASASVVVRRTPIPVSQQSDAAALSSARRTVAMEGEVTDVSRSGVGLITRSPLAHHALIRVECTPPGLPGIPLALTGRVVRCEPQPLADQGPFYRVGVAISGMSPIATTALLAFLGSADKL